MRDGLHCRRQETRCRVRVFGRRVFDHQQAYALQRGSQVAQREHDGGARALAPQKTRFARGAEHECIQRVVQRLAELDAEISGGAVEDLTACVVQRDGAITRVWQRMLETGHPARRNLDDLLVEQEHEWSSGPCLTKAEANVE